MNTIKFLPAIIDFCHHFPKIIVKEFLPAFLILLLVFFGARGQDTGKSQILGAEPVAGDTTVSDSAAAVSDTIIIPPDTMALIPGGEYSIGYNKGMLDQRPLHKVKLRSFYIDVHEVTNAQYRDFLEATGHREPLFWDDTTFNKPYLPVTGVSWKDASAYCAWAGKRLPSEAEWEVAARGGLEGEDYPWKGSLKEELANYHHNPDTIPQGIKPVGQYLANGFGLYDMAGNVWEWTADYYSATFYSDSAALENPRGPSRGSARVIRGGSWNYGREFQKVYYRNRASPVLRLSYLGFRCAEDAE